MRRLHALRTALSGHLVAMLLAQLACAQTHDAATPVSDPPPMSPADATESFAVPGDLQLDLALSEPDIAQPIFITFDGRGRMWVVEYRQYPFPAGINAISQDKFLRTVYDKVPPPPPRHFVGADRISIHEDADGDGAYDSHRTFAEGLNIVTSCAIGRGGVWVLNPPYLLFYPDANRDDVPDGDPEVVLEGFGLEDTHSCANSLRWGPDGWLYGAQGSTVTAAIKRPGTNVSPVRSMGQLIWRYHPETRRYEIFSEGGGNAFGVEFDRHGNVFSGHNGGDARGFHYQQGAYLQKGFAKHGPLSNPYAFGYFPAMRHPAAPRFTHAFVIYDGNGLPQSYRGALFAVAPLQGEVIHSKITPIASTFETIDLARIMTTTDRWFRPVDIKAGPDGGLYVIDMYESQIAHLQHHAGAIHKTSGRIYRLGSKLKKAPTANDMTKSPSEELLKLLAHPNKWHRETARRILADRRDPNVVAPLKQLLGANAGQLGLESLWALYVSGGLDEATSLSALGHPNAHVRAWIVRLLGDDGQVSSRIAEKLHKLALSEPHVEVRAQLASSAKRLPIEAAAPILAGLIQRDEDVDDARQPLLLWWALEHHCSADANAAIALINDNWDRPLVQQHLLQRLMRRFAATGMRKDLERCAQLLKLAPDERSKTELIRGFEAAYQGRSMTNLPEELLASIESGASMVLELRRGSEEAMKEALQVVADDSADIEARLQYVRLFGEIRQPRCVPVLLDLVRSSRDDVLRVAAIVSLLPYDDGRVVPLLLEGFSQFTDEVRQVALTLLVSRKSSAAQLLAAIEAGAIDPRTLSWDVMRQLRFYGDPAMNEALARHFDFATDGDSKATAHQIERLKKVLASGSGSPYEGKRLFTQTCAKCHTLFGEGGRIGPDLTAFNRGEIDAMLLHIVSPDAEIREGFETFLALTNDGRAHAGFLVDKDQHLLVLRGADGQDISIPQEDIDQVEAQTVSLMPQGLLDKLTENQVRSLFAYLRASQPLNE